MSTELVLNKAEKHLAKYKDMCRAIAICEKFDDCKDIIDRSVALAAYYAQIKDTETELMFNRIRVRAWRRIGELFSVVDLGGCETQIAKVKKIRAAFDGDIVVKDMTDSRIANIIKLMTISDDDFEYAIKQKVKGNMPDLFDRTPEAQARREANEKHWKEFNSKPKPQESAAVRTAREAEEERAALEDEHERELWQAADVAMNEVGITLERKDRANIKQVVFLIKAEVHAVMRKAAFDKKITMQEVLRRGLKLWLEANGYEFPDGPSGRVKSSARGASTEDRTYSLGG